MSPRPILKGSNRGTLSHTHHYPHHHSVHFPPSPALTRTFVVHSASTYDRSPIVVSPNDCALPERGCPGRTYFDESSTPSTRRSHYAKGYHPRAFCSLGSSYEVPPLIPDLSSESEESDGPSSLPPASPVAFGPHGIPIPSSSLGVKTVTNSSLGLSTHGYVACDQDVALAFLPYSPSSPSPASYPYEDIEDSLHRENPRSRRRDKKHESSADPDRIPKGEAQHAFSYLSVSRPSSPPVLPSRSPSTPRKKGTKKHQISPPQQQSSFSSSFSDDGCLGGF